MNRRLLAALVAAPLFLGVVGCGSHSVHTDATSKKTSAAGTHTMPDGSKMSDSDMKGMSAGAEKASETASMICGPEIQGAVQRTFKLPKRPVGLSSFADRLFQCTYQLGDGDLRMSVKDLDTEQPGRAYFDGLRARLPKATAIKGMENFGFPAFETPRGDVVFIKDHKTLWVDASRLTASELPPNFSRQDVAYAIAAAVIACWTE